MITFAQIQNKLKSDDILSFGNLEERAAKLNTSGNPHHIYHHARYLARQQILKIMGSGLSTAEELKYYKEYFKQQIGGKYLLLPINNKHQVNLQRSPALQKLVDTGYIKIQRSRVSMGYGTKAKGWKPYGTHQTYLTLNENNVVH